MSTNQLATADEIPMRPAFLATASSAIPYPFAINQLKINRKRKINETLKSVASHHCSNCCMRFCFGQFLLNDLTEANCFVKNSERNSEA